MIRLEITALLALGALTHGITELGGRVLLLQLTVHLHDLLVPVRGTLRYFAGLALATSWLIVGGRDVHGDVRGNAGGRGIDRGSGNAGGIGATSLTTRAAFTTLVFGHLYLCSIFLHT